MYEPWRVLIAFSMIGGVWVGGGGGGGLVGGGGGVSRGGGGADVSIV